jgi:hypothetical protein
VPHGRDQLRATQAAAIEDNGVLVVAFAIADGSSLTIQRAADDGPYCLVLDPGQRTHYGGVRRHELSADGLRLRLELDTAAADALELASVVEIVADPPAGIVFDDLRDDLARALAQRTLRSGDPVANTLTTAIQSGDVDGLTALLAEHPDLASARLERGKGARTPLHVAADWPGYFPNAPEVARLLLAAGADPNAPATGGAHAETPLHWAASSDDVEVAQALIDGGADIDAPGGSIAGTPLANAVGYGCWHVARLLVARGARVETLWQAAALGLLARMQELLADATQEDVDEALWQACHGGQRRAAAYLLARGADIDASPGYAADQTPRDIAAAADTRREGIVAWLRATGAKSAGD